MDISFPVIPNMGMEWSFHSITIFIPYQNISRINITLPNGAQTPSSISGTVKISDVLVLQNVFYVPQFTVNLILVTQLIMQHNCYLLINNDTCTIKQNVTGKMIGSIKRRNGLYFVQNSDNLSTLHYVQSYKTSTCNANACLWHLRLGHVFDSKF